MMDKHSNQVVAIRRIIKSRRVGKYIRHIIGKRKGLIRLGEGSGGSGGRPSRYINSRVCMQRDWKFDDGGNGRNMTR
jgi:hypothetical protein